MIEWFNVRNYKLIPSGQEQTNGKKKKFLLWLLGQESWGKKCIRIEKFNKMPSIIIEIPFSIGYTRVQNSQLLLILWLHLQIPFNYKLYLEF